MKGARPVNEAKAGHEANAKGAKTGGRKKKSKKGKRKSAVAPSSPPVAESKDADAAEEVLAATKFSAPAASAALAMSAGPAKSTAAWD